MSQGFTDANIFSCANKIDSLGRNVEGGKRKAARSLMGDDIVDSFGPSRLTRPSRIAFSLPGARKAAGEEIQDLSARHWSEPPCHGSSAPE